MNYTAVYETDPNGGYTVSIPALPGCVTEGETFEEATKNIKEAAELYLEVAKDKGIKISGQEHRVIVAPILVGA